MIVLGLAGVVEFAVATVVNGIAVETRGMPGTFRRRRRSCESVTSIVRATVREHATLPTVVCFIITTELNEFGVEAFTGVGDRLLTVLQRIRTVP